MSPPASNNSIPGVSVFPLSTIVFVPLCLFFEELYTPLLFFLNHRDVNKVIVSKTWHSLCVSFQDMVLFMSKFPSTIIPGSMLVMSFSRPMVFSEMLYNIIPVVRSHKPTVTGYGTERVECVVFGLHYPVISDVLDLTHQVSASKQCQTLLFGTILLPSNLSTLLIVASTIVVRYLQQISLFST